MPDESSVPSPPLERPSSLRAFFGLNVPFERPDGGSGGRSNREAFGRPRLDAAYFVTVNRVAIVSSLGCSLVLLFAAACSQSTAHPDPLGDCTSAYGCNPALGGNPPSGGSTGITDSGTSTSGDSTTTGTGDSASSDDGAATKDALSGGD